MLGLASEVPMEHGKSTTPSHLHWLPVFSVVAVHIASACLESEGSHFVTTGPPHLPLVRHCNSCKLVPSSKEELDACEDSCPVDYIERSLIEIGKSCSMETIGTQGQASGNEALVNLVLTMKSNISAINDQLILFPEQLESLASPCQVLG